MHVFLESNLKKCILSITLPLIISGIAIMIGVISGVTQSEYVGRIHDNPGLMSKFIFNSILGIIGISLWYKYFTHVGIVSLLYYNRVLVEHNGTIYCFGREICKINSIDNIDIESTNLKISLFISHNGKKEYCGNLLFCDGVDGLVDAVDRFKLRQFRGHNTN